MRAFAPRKIADAKNEISALFKQGHYIFISSRPSVKRLVLCDAVFSARAQVDALIFVQTAIVQDHARGEWP